MNQDGLISALETKVPITDRVRWILRIACVAAYRQNKTATDPIHVLLGIGEEGGGIAVHVMNSLGVTLTNLRSAALAPASLCRPGSGQPPPLHMPFSDATRELLDRAADEAIALDHGFLGSEHLRLAFEQSGQADPTFRELEVDARRVRKKVLSIITNRLD